MQDEQPAQLTASEAARRIGSGALTSEELVQACLERIREVEPKVQKAIVESLDSGKAADIVEEMDPDAAADLLADLHMDAPTIIAAILHDVIEDTPTAKDEIAERFGADVAELVDGVTKLDQIKFKSREEAQAESFRKMLLAMVRDLRVILVKLADRTHNMRTIEAMAPARRRAAGPLRPGRRGRSAFASGRMELWQPAGRRAGSARGCASCWSWPRSHR